MNRSVEIELKLFVCTSCGRDFTYVAFGGDTDMATDGLCAASSRETLDAAIVEATGEEWAELATRQSALIERRLSQTLGRADFVVLQSRYEDVAQIDTSGMSFKDFSKVWKPTRQWLTSPCCAGAEAREGDAMTPAQLAARGGRILAVGDLVVTEPS